MCNEMLKSCGSAMENALLTVYNTCLSHGLIASEWRKDQLRPLFKSGIKSDPNNFRGICVSSCVGKTLNSMLRYRLEGFCKVNCLLGAEQASGQTGARTSDHLLVLHHLIQKYVKNNKKVLYVCYVDLRKAYDSCNRTKLFYELLNQYQIGGKFLRVIQDIYSSNYMFIKLDDGLTKPFRTTVGCKQGCNISSILFNLFIGRLPTVFDAQCNGLMLDNKSLNCLLWADDCVLLSQSSEGLQRSIDKAVQFFEEQGLNINISKTQCMIFNCRGRKAKEFSHLKFTANGQQLKIADEYVYLGLTFTPSGSSLPALDALHAKASRAYFSIANILYTNKRMPVERALRLADSIVFPVSSYAAEYLTPLVLMKKSFSSQYDLLRSWENYLPEKTNQRLCRLLLSVHKKSSRLAVLGEMGRYPLLMSSMASCITYSQSLLLSPPNTLVARAYREMQSMVAAGRECWLGKVITMKKLLEVQDPSPNCKPSTSRVQRVIRSKFDVFYLSEVNKMKLGGDGLNHN